MKTSIKFLRAGSVRLIAFALFILIAGSYRAAHAQCQLIIADTGTPSATAPAIPAGEHSANFTLTVPSCFTAGNINWIKVFCDDKTTNFSVTTNSAWDCSNNSYNNSLHALNGPAVLSGGTIELTISSSNPASFSIYALSTAPTIGATSSILQSNVSIH